MFFHILGIIIIPTDELHHFQRGRAQAPSSDGKKSWVSGEDFPNKQPEAGDAGVRRFGTDRGATAPGRWARKKIGPGNSSAASNGRSPPVNVYRLLWKMDRRNS